MRFTLSKPSGSAFYGHPCPKRLSEPVLARFPLIMCIFIFSGFSAKYNHGFVKSFSPGHPDPRACCLTLARYKSYDQIIYSF